MLRAVAMVFVTHSLKTSPYAYSIVIARNFAYISFFGWNSYVQVKIRFSSVKLFVLFAVTAYV